MTKEQKLQIQQLANKYNSAKKPTAQMLLQCIHDIIKVYGCAKAAEEVGISRSYLYQLLNPKTNHKFISLITYIQSIGIRVKIEPIKQSKS